MISNLLVGLVAIIHVYILVLEMFLWTTPRGLRVFRQTLETAKMTELLAKNQGLYNGFLSAGLFWSILCTGEPHAILLKYFFLGCVFIAGVFGAWTVSRRILLVQSVPAALAALFTFLSI